METGRPPTKNQCLYMLHNLSRIHELAWPAIVTGPSYYQTFNVRTTYVFQAENTDWLACVSSWAILLQTKNATSVQVMYITKSRKH